MRWHAEGLGRMKGLFLWAWDRNCAFLASDMVSQHHSNRQVVLGQ